MNYFVVVLIAISLSMDAFSLALSIGTLKFNNKINIGLSLLVGVFHFIMPLLGTILGGAFVQRVHMDTHLLSAIIFFYIAIMMFKDFKKGEESFHLSLIGALLFALGVSLDSFGIGFAMPLDRSLYVSTFLTFTFFSSFFTYLGLNLGKIINSVVGDYSILLGAIIMAVLGLINFCQFLL